MQCRQGPRGRPSGAGETAVRAVVSVRAAGAPRGPSRCTPEWALRSSSRRCRPASSHQAEAPRERAEGRDTVRVTADQMHQLAVAKVELYPFRVQKFAVGQIAYNEDTSTAVLAPFPGRVTRLIAKVGDKVQTRRALFEIDSPEVVQPQNDFVTAIAALNKARSQLDLARIVEKRFKDLYEARRR